ncbi:MAG: hypothetical protein IJ408_05640 [Clostridia bacterium]|nr:hypothetical protein [Clostridia bacterium]
MNTGKRLLSVLVCIAMLFSMMTTFAFASSEGSVGESESVPATDVNTLTGAKPTTDVAAPTVDASVFVVDSTVTADTTGYVLTWEGDEYSTHDVDGVATDMFQYGVNLFASIKDAQAVAPVGATYLVKSVAYSVAYGNNAEKENLTKAGNFYTEAYNTMPFVVGTAFDGSDWSLNEDYLAKTVKLNGVSFVVTDAANSGDFNLYGFSVEYGSYAYDFNNATVAMNVNVQNAYYIPTADSSTMWISIGTFAGLDAAATSNVQFKNFYLGGSTGRFLSEYVPNYFTIDGFYMPSDVDMGGTPYIKQGSNNKASMLTFKNWNLQNEDLNIYFQGNNTKNYFVTAADAAIAGASGNKDWRAITIENCTLNNSAFYTLSGRFMYMYANSTSMFYIKGNRLINTTDTVANVFVNNSTTWGNYLSVDCQNNFFQGYKACDGFASNNGNSTNGITIKDNYLSDGVTEVGTDLYIKSTNASNDWYSSDWYLDPAMTVKATELIGAYNTNAVAHSKSGFDILLCVPAGETASLSSSDAALSVADANLNALTAGSYTVTATKTVEEVEYTANYTVNVVEFTNPLISEVEDTTGLIDGDKVLFVDASAKDAAAGSLVEVEWKGNTYSAVAGVTVFATLTAAQNYAKAQAIDTPNFLIKSEYYGGVISGETEWNTFVANVPGKYFTQNYDKKPYVASDRALDPDGSEWASNVNTGEADSFNTADGIEVKWFSMSASNGAAGKAGKYEFYGFTITNCFQDEGSRDGDIDVYFQNTYIPKTYSNAFFTPNTNAFNTYASANTYNDNITFKDTYWDGSNNAASKKGLFQSGDTYLWANITLDGFFGDFCGYTDGANHWINHYYDAHSFTIKNSNFRNAQEKIMMQGDNGKGANKGTGDATNRTYEKKYILENNIFYNYTFSGNYTSAFAYVKQAYHTTMLFNDNFVYTGRDNVVNLLSGTGGDSRQPNTYVTVNNNTLLGINSTYNINRWVSTHTGFASGTNGNYVTSSIVSAEDVLAGNVTATGENFVLLNNNHSGGVKNYTRTDVNAWADYAKTTKISDINGNIKAYVPDGGFYILSASGTVTAKVYLPSTITAADITVNDDMPVWYDTEGNEVDPTDITKESVNVTDGDGNVIGADYVIETIVYAGTEDEPVEYTVKINVNVVPNTITAYPKSDYSIVEATNSKGETVEGFTHPTEVEVYEDMPHISGGLIDDYGMINSVNAAIIDGCAGYPYDTTDPRRYTIQNGEYKMFEWNDVDYVAQYGTSFYWNVDVAYTGETAIGNANPEYLLNASEWSWVPEHGFYGGSGGTYMLRSPGKFFTENYATEPYFAGDEFGNDWTPNIGTEYGQFNPDAYIKAAYLTIDNDAKPGRYEVYGFTVGIGVRDGRTTNVEPIDLYLKNTYFSCEGANSYIFSSNESNCKAVMNGSPDSKLYVETAYVASKGDRSFLRNSAWSDITFDGMYADFADNTKTSTSYFHQVYDETQLVIKNSFFTNTLTDLTLFEGFNDGTNAYGPHATNGNYATFNPGRKAIVLENNIFKNYSFAGKSQFMNVKGGYLSEIVLRNNYIDNSEAETSMKLFNGIDSSYARVVDPEMTLIIEDNTFIGFNGTLGTTGIRGISDESSFARNLTKATADSAPIAMSTPNGFTSDYYLDSYKEILSSDLEIAEWTTEGVEYGINNATHTVVVTTEGGTPTVADAITNGTITVYSDAELTEAIGDIAVGTNYVKISTTNSFDEEVSLVYTVSVIGTSDNFFKDVYVVPETDDIKTPIDATKALIIDWAVNEASFGEIVTVSWQGTDYDFIKGVTAFATLAELEAYLSTSDIENPHVLMKSIVSADVAATSGYKDLADYGIKSKGEIIISFAGNFYTENYNIKPYTVTDGVWAVNPEFDLNNTIVARWIKTNQNLGAGTVELYGFAVTAAFQNNGEAAAGSKTEATDLYIENAYADSTADYSAPRAPFGYDSYYVRTQANPAGGSFIVKNMYVSSAFDRARTLVSQSNMASTVELDGIFIDNSNALEIYDRSAEENLDEVKIILDGDSSFTIKNSYASGARYSTRFVVLTEEHEQDGARRLVFDNNIFENITFGGADAFVQVDGDYNDVVITNNVVNNTAFDTPNVFEVVEYYEVATGEDDASFTITAADTVSATDLKLTITNNKFTGFGSETTVVRDLDEASVIDSNFVALNDMGGKALTIVGDNITLVDENALVDAEGSLDASTIYEMTINGADFNEDGQVADVEVRYNREAIDLYEYLVNVYNVVEVYGDEGMTHELDASNIAIDTATVYLKVMSVDGTAIQTRVVNFTIGAAPDAAVEAISVTLYNDMSINFKTVGTEVYDNVYAEVLLNGKFTSISDFTVDGDYIVYTFDGIAPHLMNETITFKLYADVDGTATEISSFETTLAEYFYEIKTAYEVENYELYSLAVAALNYGAAAQNYKNFNTDALANANLEDYEKEVVGDVYENNFNAEVAVVEDAAATWCAKGLYLDNAMDLKLAFVADDIEGLTVQVKAADGTITTVDTFVHRDGKYFVYFDGFNAAQLKDVFEFTVMNGTTAVSNTVAYSVESYAATAVDAEIELLTNIMDAMMAYGNAAALYVETYIG